jgi:hypothetical protein
MSADANPPLWVMTAMRGDDHTRPDAMLHAIVDRWCQAGARNRQYRRVNGSRRIAERTNGRATRDLAGLETYQDHVVKAGTQHGAGQASIK